MAFVNVFKTVIYNIRYVLRGTAVHSDFFLISCSYFETVKSLMHAWQFWLEFDEFISKNYVAFSGTVLIEGQLCT